MIHEIKINLHLQRAWLVAAAFSLVSLGLIPDVAHAKRRKISYCSQTAKLARSACLTESKDDLLVARANCLNIEDSSDRRECYAEAKEERQDATDECKEVYSSRKEVCDEVGESRYDPEFTAGNFVDPDDIGGSVTPNPYFPLVVGNTWVFEGNGETITVTVTDKTKLINGVTCRVITDVVLVDGEPLEITVDWYAQHSNGDVWYCGEVAQNFEVFEGDMPEEAELVDIEGSWKAGRDGAKPGITMFFSPQVGTTYRQEMFLGDAEDVAEVTSVTGSESVPGGSCNGNCLITRDFTPLDPGVNEYKYYAPGIGQLLEIDAEGNRIELTSFSNN